MMNSVKGNSPNMPDPNTLILHSPVTQKQTVQYLCAPL